jgi:hypothetical protein
MSDPIARLVATWVAQLDHGRAQSVLRSLAQSDYEAAERQLSAVVGSAVRLSDERVRDQLGDQLEERLAGPPGPGETEATSLFPLEPVGAVDVREDDPTDEVARARIAKLLNR